MRLRPPATLLTNTSDSTLPAHSPARAPAHPPQVATARVKGAAKLEIPHLEDHVSKIECVGVQTQKKLEDIRAASAAANVPDLHLPINSVTKGEWVGGRGRVGTRPACCRGGFQAGGPGGRKESTKSRNPPGPGRAPESRKNVENGPSPPLRTS